MLRRPLALYVERGAKPRRIDPVTRVRLALLSRFPKSRDARVVVRPETAIRWHRAGWRLYWHLKSRPARPRIPKQVQDLIRRMGNENPTWGEERIANELPHLGNQPVPNWEILHVSVRTRFAAMRVTIGPDLGLRRVPGCVASKPASMSGGDPGSYR